MVKGAYLFLSSVDVESAIFYGRTGYDAHISLAHMIMKMQIFGKTTKLKR